MSKSLEITEREVKAFNDSIKRDLTSKRITNTGNAAASLRVDSKSSLSKDTVVSIGISYLEQLDQGRSPGRFPPVNKMRQWVSQKLGITDPKANNQVAFLVGRKISKEGTFIFNNKSKGIQLDNKIEELNKRLLEKLPEAFAFEIINSIKNR